MKKTTTFLSAAALVAVLTACSDNNQEEANANAPENENESVNNEDNNAENENDEDSEENGENSEDNNAENESDADDESTDITVTKSDDFEAYEGFDTDELDGIEDAIEMVYAYDLFSDEWIDHLETNNPIIGLPGEFQEYADFYSSNDDFSAEITDGNNAEIHIVAEPDLHTGLIEGYGVDPNEATHLIQAGTHSEFNAEGEESLGYFQFIKLEDGTFILSNMHQFHD